MPPIPMRIKTSNITLNLVERKNEHTERKSIKAPAYRTLIPLITFPPNRGIFPLIKRIRDKIIKAMLIIFL